MRDRFRKAFADDIDPVLRLPDLPITETIDEVIVYHADRLHVGIHHRRTNETESAMLKILAERIGFE